MPNRSFRLSSALEYAHFIVIRQCPMAPMGYPGYVRNHACALPSPLPFYYVMAKNVPAMLNVAPCTVGRTVERS